MKLGPASFSASNGKTRRFFVELSAILDHAVSSNFIGILVFSIFVIGVGVLMDAYFHNRLIWWGYVTVAALANILLFCVFYAWDKSIAAAINPPPVKVVPAADPSQNENPRFAARAISTMLPSPLGRERFIDRLIFTDTTIRGEQRYRLSAAMFVELTNNGPDPLYISQYAVEIRTRDGGWASMRSVPVERGLLYQRPEPGQLNVFLKDNPTINVSASAKFEVEPKPRTFNEAIGDKTVGVGETVSGWLFLILPGDGPVANLGLRIIDAKGRESSSPIQLPIDGVAGIGSVPSMTGFAIKTARDIEGLPLTEYPEQTALTSTQAAPQASVEDRLPGMSMHLYIRLSNLAVARRKYILDFGHIGKSRLSLYVSSDNILYFSFVDANGETHSIQTPIGQGGFPLDQFCYLGCELGVGGGFTMMRMQVNGIRIDSLSMPFKTDMGPLELLNGVMGGDLAESNGAKFDLAELATFSSTLRKVDLNKIYEGMRAAKRDGYIEFGGTHSMRFSEVAKANASPSTQK